MKRISFLLGLVIGFFLGSRAGRGPYEQFEARLRTLAERRETQGRIADRLDEALCRETKAVSEAMSQAVDKPSSAMSRTARRIDPVGGANGQ